MAVASALRMDEKKACLRLRFMVRLLNFNLKMVCLFKMVWLLKMGGKLRN